MDLFNNSYLPSFAYYSHPGSEPGTLLTSPGNAVTVKAHSNFMRLLQHAQALGIKVLPLVWEPAFERLGPDGTTGRINEMRLNARYGFAFKRFKPDLTDPSLTLAQFRDQQYQAMINEITILSCEPIKNHANITVLVGLGFEVFPMAGEIWPVLIFSKFNQGDLAHFVTKSPVQEEAVLLGLCCELAKAVRILHVCSESEILLVHITSSLNTAEARGCFANIKGTQTWSMETSSLAMSSCLKTSKKGIYLWG